MILYQNNATYQRYNEVIILKVVLLSLPGLSVFAPPLSLLSLTNYLKNNDIEVFPIDVSIEFFHDCLNPDILCKRYPISLKIANTLLEQNNIVKDSSSQLYSQLTEWVDDYDGIIDALREVWTTEGFNLENVDNFSNTIDMINKALFFLFLPFGTFNLNININKKPLSWYPNKISIHKRWDNSKLIYSQKNPIIQYYKNKLIPALKKHQPDLIGISFSYISQAQNGYVMIRELVKHLNVPIVVGGSFFYYLCELKQKKIDSNHSLFHKIVPFLYPYGILGEGEEPLLQLCQAIEQKHSIRDIPNLFYLEKETISFHREAPPMQSNKLPLIELNQFSIGKKYITPIRIAPLMTSRGCYWNRCTFCDHANVIGNRWREIEPEETLKNLKIYKEKYGIEFVLFCDESTSPKMLQRLSQLIIKEKLNIHFGTMSRLEKKLLTLIKPLSQAGCRFLSFGLESGCQRVINLMDKGFLIEDAQKIIDECNNHDIMVELFIMFGFPTEKLSESLETINFLESNHDKIHVFRANPWSLKLHSSIANNLSQYSIKEIPGHRIRSDDYNSYHLEAGISHRLSRELINEMQRNKKLKNKIIHSTVLDFKQEEYHIINYLYQCKKAEPCFNSTQRMICKK